MVSCFSPFFTRRRASASTVEASEKTRLIPSKAASSSTNEKLDLVVKGQPPSHFKRDEFSKEKLSALRVLMKQEGIDTYVIPTSDAHSSEYVGACDKRREWISGFTGSAGVAVITLGPDEGAFMFVDSRYHTQAAQELDPTVWIVQKVGLKDVRNWDDWLIHERPKGSVIGLDPTLFTYSAIQSLLPELNARGHSLEFPGVNLVDQIWKDRPLREARGVVVHGQEFAGETTRSKLSTLRRSLTSSSSSNNLASTSYLVSSLTNIAYLLNLRGTDIDFNPVFYSYLLIDISSDSDRNGGGDLLFLQPNVLSSEALLQLEKDGIEVRNYDEVKDEIKGRKLLSDKIISYSLVLAVGTDNLTILPESPVALMESIKNPVEIAGFRKAYIRDAVAWVKWAAWLEEEIVKKGAKINEWDAAEELTKCRKEGKYFRGLAYDNISATNENAALPHYAPTASKSRIIDQETPYLNDSGAQYLDGTIDTTRTVHFGRPTPPQRRAFTRVLQGHIAIDTLIFPSGTTGFQMDIIARKAMWGDGMDYQHGTGHGVGEYLSVHEGPQGIGPSVGYNAFPFLPGQTTSNEPGYYQVGSFGIRLESILVVKEVDTLVNFGDKKWLGFERFTMIPIQSSFADMRLLSPFEKKWLKEHNRKSLKVLEPLLDGDKRALKWLKRQ